MAGGHPATQLFATRNTRRQVEQAAAEAMVLCGIAHLADVPAARLSTGERRLVEVARCLAGRFDVMLLDEPSGGLDHDETRRLGDVLISAVQRRRCGILLVEHDMALVMRICDHLYVLDFGKLLFEGSPAAVAESPIVKAAYLGSEAIAGASPVPFSTATERLRP
jgi:ABC-type branched-subunit amino acid transport system ATPase component